MLLLFLLLVYVKLKCVFQSDLLSNFRALTRGGTDGTVVPRPAEPLKIEIFHPHDFFCPLHWPYKYDDLSRNSFKLIVDECHAILDEWNCKTLSLYRAKYVRDAIIFDTFFASAALIVSLIATNKKKHSLR